MTTQTPKSNSGILTQAQLQGLPLYLLAKLKGAKFWRAPAGYICLFENNNAELFVWLHSEGVFKWFSTNNGRSIALHQIIVFFCCGGKRNLIKYNGRFTVKQGVHECHHINGITDDNRPTNLVLISTLRHQRYLNTLQRGIDPGLYKSGHFTSFFTNQELEAHTSQSWEMNRQGEKVTSVHLWFAHIVFRTVTECCSVVTKAKYYVKDLVAWVRTYARRLGNYFSNPKLSSSNMGALNMPKPNLPWYQQLAKPFLDDIKVVQQRHDWLTQAKAKGKFNRAAKQALKATGLTLGCAAA